MMDRLRGWWRPMRAVFSRGNFEREMDEEIRFHLEMEASRLEREEGLPAPEARRRAILAFGRVERSKEGVRDVRWTRPLEELGRDVRLTLRRLSQDFGFATVAVVTLALGIGGTAAVFSVINGVLLEPLPYEEPDRIVTLWERLEDGRPNSISEPNFEDWRERSRSFEVMALHGNPEFGGPTTVLGAEMAVRARPTPVFDGFLSVFRIAPVLGRSFVEEDRQQGAPGVVLVSHSFWRNHLAPDPDVSGRVLELWGYVIRGGGRAARGIPLPGGHGPVAAGGAAQWRQRTEPTGAQLGGGRTTAQRRDDGGGERGVAADRRRAPGGARGRR